MKQVITNATIFTGKEILTGSAILIDDGNITGLQAALRPQVGVHLRWKAHCRQRCRQP